MVGVAYGSASKEGPFPRFEKVFVDRQHVHFDYSLRGLDERPEGGPNDKARFIKSLTREADVLKSAAMLQR